MPGGPHTSSRPNYTWGTPDINNCGVPINFLLDTEATYSVLTEAPGPLSSQSASVMGLSGWAKRWAWYSMWAYLCWLQKSWVCHLILKTMPSCPGLSPTQHFTISLTAGFVERSPLHQWKASRGGHLYCKEKTFSKSANTFNNNRMRCLFLNWWHLTILRWTDVITVDIIWLFILILTWFNFGLPWWLRR